MTNMFEQKDINRDSLVTLCSLNSNVKGVLNAQRKMLNTKWRHYHNITSTLRDTSFLDDGLEFFKATQRYV